MENIWECKIGGEVGDLPAGADGPMRRVVMRTIHKYTLDYGHTEIPLPCGAEVLTVQLQHDAICLWAAIDTDQAMELRTFLVKGTGHPLPDRGLRYVGTVQEAGGRLVWHVFEQLFVEGRDAESHSNH